MLITSKNDKKFSSRSVPIWFMRQAGRYLPEYHVLRNKEKSFLKTCFNPEIAAEISLQPIMRFDFDFIILFADILVIPHALGQKVDFVNGIGPVLDKFDLNRKNCNSEKKVFKILGYFSKKYVFFFQKMCVFFKKTVFFSQKSLYFL